MYFQSIKNELQEYIQKTFPEVGFSDSFHLSKPPDSKLGHLAYFPLATSSIKLSKSTTLPSLDFILPSGK